LELMMELLFDATAGIHMADTASPNRIATVGRLTLWSVTLTLVLLSCAAVTSALWLLTPLQSEHRFLMVHRATLCCTLLTGLSAFLILFLLHRFLVPPRSAVYRPIEGSRVHVGLTAWNDEEAVAHAVRDFKACPYVHKVVVIDNDSKDNTVRAAQGAGADEVIVETTRGYGACCMRALDEAAKGADIVVLCEADMTFAASDVKKFLAYIENCDLVLGTRSTQELRESDTQMDWLLNPGNWIVAKLVQARFWGTRLTDMGCTYRAMRVRSYLQLREHLRVTGNHFSPHMFIEALKLRMRVLEIPVYFRARMGQSKGVGSNKIKAARVALKMLGLIYAA
jgi:hypothetical protein